MRRALCCTSASLSRWITCSATSSENTSPASLCLSAARLPGGSCNTNEAHSTDLSVGRHSAPAVKAQNPEMVHSKHARTTATDLIFKSYLLRERVLSLH